MSMQSINAQKNATPANTRDPIERAGDFGEVCLGYTEDEARNEARRCLDCKTRPCVAGCPVGVDVPSFVRAVADGDFARAGSIVFETNSLPAICGRVCPQETQCQGRCTRGRNGEPVEIGLLERFVADWAAEHENGAAGGAASARGDAGAPGAAGARESVERLPEGSKVACVGSGPASLTCAAELLARGARVTIFEALHEPGGVLAYGIPEFRLPKSLLRREIERLAGAGAEIRTNAVIGSLFTSDELMGEMGYDAVFIATGAGLPRYLSIPGEGLCGVCTANELLTRVNLMRAMDFPESGTPVHVGERCVVVGGGNVAIDAARTAKRLGSDVTILYRRTEEDMPARREELEHAVEEGVSLHTLAAPLAAVADDRGWIERLHCQKMHLGEPDESGRRRPEPVSGAEFDLACDMLVVAVGSRPNPLAARTTLGLVTTGEGLIAIDPATAATGVPGVFAGGDATTGAATVIEAMGAGKRAAASIADYLLAKS